MSPGELPVARLRPDHPGADEDARRRFKVRPSDMASVMSGEKRAQLP